jgi:phage terminase large subunit GpA-like protein
MAVEHYRASIQKAKGSPDLMMKFVRYRGCRTFTPPTPDDQISHKVLAARSADSPYLRQTVPAWCDFLVAGIDHQKRELYFTVVGYSMADDRWAVVDFGYRRLVEYVDGRPAREPTKADRRRELEKLRGEFRTGYRVQGSDDKFLPVVLAGEDVGYATDEIYGLMVGQQDVVAVRGVGYDGIKGFTGKQIPIKSEVLQPWCHIKVMPGRTKKVFKVAGHQVRMEVHSALLRNPTEPAAGLLPQGCKSSGVLCMHLSGEIMIQEGDKWVAYQVPGHRHDLLDALIYALVLARYQAYEIIKRKVKQAERLSWRDRRKDRRRRR